MPPGKPAKKKWVFYGRWALIPTIIGVLILTFVIFTGERYAWTLWIALPLLMIGLGYIFVINAIASLIAIGKSGDESESEEEKRDAA
jgi:amino acid transporter